MSEVKQTVVTLEDGFIVTRTPFKAGDEKTAPVNETTRNSRTLGRTPGGFVQVPGAPEGVRVQVNCIASLSKEEKAKLKG